LPLIIRIIKADKIAVKFEISKRCRIFKSLRAILNAEATVDQKIIVKKAKTQDFRLLLSLSINYLLIIVMN